MTILIVFTCVMNVRYHSMQAFCHRLWSHFVMDRASLFTDHKISSRPILVRGVSWSEVATVPKRKSHRGLDLNLSWNSEEDIWKGWKKSGGTK